jgi:hypothetical protein
MQQLAKKEFLRTEFYGKFYNTICYKARDINESDPRFFLYFNCERVSWWISDTTVLNGIYEVSDDIMLYFVGEAQFKEMVDKVNSYLSK